MKNLSWIRTLPWARIGMISLCSVLSLILIVMIFATAYVEYLFGMIQRPGTEMDGTDGTPPSNYFTDPTLPSGYTGVTINPSDVTLPSAPEILVSHNQIVNIMLVGQDRRDNQNYRTQSDAMILCTINKKDKTITLTSFMRDLYVNIPGYGGNKLNAAYPRGGMPLLGQTLKENFGIQVDSFVVVDFKGFKKVVDVLGGVDIHLTQAEVTYLMTTGSGLGESDSSSWALKPGINRLNGDQALAYSRIRAIGDDFGRTERQRNVITAVLEKCKSLNFGQLNTLLTELLPLVTTDMTNSQITNYMIELFPLISGSNLSTQRIPIAGSYEFTDIGAIVDVVLADTEVNRKFLIETLMPK